MARKQQTHAGGLLAFVDSSLGFPLVLLVYRDPRTLARGGTSPVPLLSKVAGNSEVVKALLDHIDEISIATPTNFALEGIAGSNAKLQDRYGAWALDPIGSQRGVDVHTNSGRTTLQLIIAADELNYPKLWMIEDLMSRAGINLELRDREKRTPFIALASRLSQSVDNHFLGEAMKQLLIRGVCVNAQDAAGHTALHYQCRADTFTSIVSHAIGCIIGIQGTSLGNLQPPPPLPLSSSTTELSTHKETNTFKTTTTASADNPGDKVKVKAGVDIPNNSKETATQAFFSKLTSTQNRDLAYSNDVITNNIAIKLLKLSSKEKLDVQLLDGSRLFHIASTLRRDVLIRKLYDLGVDTQARDETRQRRTPLELFAYMASKRWIYFDVFYLSAEFHPSSMLTARV
ncbi:hypothetical protein BP5796_08869 [Coleophoma crateriformis]|uniref:Uncharacterized protein n=1 Tax=Coleophoma crateriformis TaxID=565419 RepID=A0A3D8R2D2_9HELO|nr:hypothetical protein BP5796_08869 [Coleophoma crateriformis]